MENNLNTISFDYNEDVPDDVWEQYADYMAYGDWEPGVPYDLVLTTDIEVISIEIDIPQELYNRICNTGEDISDFMTRSAERELDERNY